MAQKGSNKVTSQKLRPVRLPEKFPFTNRLKQPGISAPRCVLLCNEGNGQAWKTAFACQTDTRTKGIVRELRSAFASAGQENVRCGKDDCRPLFPECGASGTDLGHYRLLGTTTLSFAGEQFAFPSFPDILLRHLSTISL